MTNIINLDRMDVFKGLIDEPSFSETVFRRIKTNEDYSWVRQGVESTEEFHYRYGEKGVVIKHHKEEKWEWQDK